MVFRKKSVNSVLSPLYKAMDSLDVVRDTNIRKSEKLHDKAQRIEAERRDADAEAELALKFRRKLESLLND